MARDINLFSRSRIAAADLSASQFCAVKLDNTGKVALPSAAGRIYGVIQNKPVSGAVAEVRILGTTKMLCGTGGVTAGDPVTPDAAGKAVTAASTNLIFGFAEETAAAGALTTVTLIQSGAL
jgi:hypothetical protein